MYVLPRAGLLEGVPQHLQRRPLLVPGAAGAAPAEVLVRLLMYYTIL